MVCENEKHFSSFKWEKFLLEAGDNGMTLLIYIQKFDTNLWRNYEMSDAEDFPLDENVFFE